MTESRVDLETVRDKVAELERRLEQTLRSRAALEAELEHRQAEVDALREQSREVGEREGRLRLRISELQRSIAELERLAAEG